MRPGLLPAGLANQLYGVFSDSFNVNIHKNTLLICNGLRRPFVRPSSGNCCTGRLKRVYGWVSFRFVEKFRTG